MRHHPIDRPIREPTLSLPVFDINLFSEPLLKRAREARRPGRDFIAARLFLDIGEEQRQVSTLDSLRASAVVTSNLK